MNFTQRSYQQELLDRDDIPFEDIKRNMQELNFINTWLGGHGITIAGVKKLVEKKSKEGIVICEIGCGGGDNIAAIHKWCDHHLIAANFIGIDINPHCIDYAKEKNSLLACDWILSDYAKVQFVRKPDIIFSSLFCHHFTEEQLVKMLQWMKANAVKGFFINDLHRHALAYHSIKLLTGIFSKSYLVKNDAPLSVRRGFSREELENLMRQSGISKYDIQWKWAFRWLVVATTNNLCSPI